VSVEITEKEKLFCIEFIKDFNATRSAIEVGYSEKSASTLAGRLLKKVHIQSYISFLIKKRQEEVNFDANEVLRRLAILARGNLSKFVKPSPDRDGFNILIDKDALTEDDMYCLSEITTEEYVEGKDEDAKTIKKTKLKLCDRLKALELAGKHTDVRAFDIEYKSPPPPPSISGEELAKFLKAIKEHDI
jgi:phage terminase small subunit